MISVLQRMLLEYACYLVRGAKGNVWGFSVFMRGTCGLWLTKCSFAVEIKSLVSTFLRNNHEIKVPRVSQAHEESVPLVLSK